MTIGESIKKLRDLRDIKQETLADMIGVGRSTMSDIENGKTDIGSQKIIELAKIFQVNISDIFDFDERKHIFFNNSPNSGVQGDNSHFNSNNNDLSLIDDLIKTKDKVIASLEAQILLMQKTQK